MAFAELSDKPYIVILAYIAAFMPWTAFSTKDFISDRWKTVRRTRIAGYINLFCSLIPALYILMYCGIQFAARDWKEGSAAAVALFFALLHGVRSAWGLWQLHVFRTWCAKSIDALAVMGVHFRFSDKRRRHRAEERRKSAWQVSDEMLVNNSIVDNQIIHGETVCHIEYGDIIHLRGPRSRQCLSGLFFFFLVWDCFVFWVKTLLCIILAAWEGLRFTARVGTNGKLRQVPNRPVEVWINWAIAFAAQGLREWMAEFKVSTNPKDDELGNRKKGSIEWQKRALYFASEVLSTCIMQLWPELDEGKTKNMEPMLWSGWDEKSVMNNGRMVKAELLKNAIESGEGLPFSAKHKQFVENEERSDKEISYRAFGRQLLSKISSLEVRKEFCTETERLDVDMLEWLAILLYMGRRSLISQEEQSKRTENDTKSGEIRRIGSAEDVVVIDDNDSDESLDQASRNLSEQLSCSVKFEKTDDEECEKGCGRARTIVPSFPFSLNWRGARSSNRHILKVGEVVDVWLSLAAGDGMRFVQELNENWSKMCKGIEHENEVGLKDVGGSSGKDEHGNRNKSVGEGYDVRLRNAHKEVEKLRLRYQFADDSLVCESGMNYGMTFMGYRMETVRSHLAEWAYWMKHETQNDHNVTSRFRGSLEDAERGVYRLSRPCVLSNELSRHLKYGQVKANLRSRQFHVRLLWELQEHFEKRMEHYGKREQEPIVQLGPESFEVIALCLLSFPSLSVGVKEVNGMEFPVMRTRDWYGINLGCWSREEYNRMAAPDDIIKNSIVVIEPICGPQCFQIEVGFSGIGSDGRTSAMISLHFRGEREFVWEWWRDAFTGRLEGLKEWQAKHYLENTLEVTPSSGPLDSMFEMYKTVTNEAFEVWKGWKPFRVEFCMFELKRSGILKENRRVLWQASPSIELGSVAMGLGFSKHERRLVAYKDVSLRVMFHVMSLIRDSIRKVSMAIRSDCKRTITNREDMEAIDLIKSADQLSTGEFDEVERALLLYEAAAMEFGSEEALEKGVELILSSISLSDTRAFDMLEMFVGCIIPYGRLTESRIGADVLAVLRGAVLRICKRLAFRCESSVIEGRLSGILLLVSRFGEWEECETVQNLMEVILCYTETLDALVGYAGFYGVIRYAQSTKTPKKLARTNLKQRVMKWNAENSEDSHDARLRRTHLECVNTDTSISGHNTIYERRLLDRIIGKKRGLQATGTLGFREVRALTNALASLHNILDYPSDSFGEAVVLHYFAKLVFGGWNRLYSLSDKVLGDEISGSLRLWVSKTKRTEDGRGMHHPGYLFVHGEGCESKHKSQAQLLWERPDQESLPTDIKEELDILFADGWKGLQEFVLRAKAMWEKAIEERGEVDAMFCLGLLLARGAQGVPRDTLRAKCLWERAIEHNGHMGAMFALGRLLADGAEGVPTDGLRAKCLWERVIEESGHVDATCALGYVLDETADEIQKQSLVKNNLWGSALQAQAMHRLGLLFLNGADGVPRDSVRAMRWWERAIEEHGYVTAMFEMGRLLVSGAVGVPKNGLRAKRLWEKALEEEEHVGAMYELGVLLLDGAEGVPRDTLRAKNLLERALNELRSRSNRPHTRGKPEDVMYELGLMLVNEGELIREGSVCAMRLWERAIEERGHVDSMFELGRLLVRGTEGVPRDVLRAKDLWERAIEKAGHASAMCNLGVLLVHGAEGVPRDALQAQKLWERAIEERAHADSMYELGVALVQGSKDVPRDASRAKHLWERAIEESGHTGAMYELGLVLVRGAEGVPKDVLRAEKLWDRAIDESEHVGAMYALGRLLYDGAEGVAEKVVCERCAENLWKRAIKNGHVGAMCQLGRLLVDRAYEFPEDALRAKELWERAIEESGHVESMYELGFLLVDGAEGIPKDPLRAKGLWERAIEDSGHVQSMYELGLLVVEGAHGIPKDPIRAKRLWERAIEETGDVESMYELGHLLFDGAEGVPKDPLRAKGLWERAIEEHEHTDSMYHLGRLTVEGAEGVPIDALRGIGLWERAIKEDDHVRAMYRLSVLLEKGVDGVAQNANRSRTLFKRIIHMTSDASTMDSLCNILEEEVDGEVESAVRARKLYESAIRKTDHVASMVNLGMMLMNGANGVPRDAKRGMHLFERAIEKNRDVNAMVCLGFVLGGAVGDEANATAMRNLFERGRERSGECFAMKWFEKMLERGTEGVPQDAKRGGLLIQNARELLGM